MIAPVTDIREIPRPHRANGKASHDGEVPQVVNALLAEAIACRASDIHVEPTGEGYELRFRVDGIVQRVHSWDPGMGRAIVGRFMVMAGLLTYRQDIPQEGRATLENAEATGLAVRVSIIPTVHGLRAAVRLPAELIQPTALGDLGLPPSVLEGLTRFASAESGMLLVTGPAGSGKTTSIYALLRYIADCAPGVSIITLEDPVERPLAGVTQIQIQPFGELTYERCLRSILRQDPQVLMLGEIRDARTATLAIQAALSGHRLISTLHAANAAGAIARLLEMGVEPYQITSSLWGVLAQRLLRRSVVTPGPGTRGEGVYRGRVPIAELAMMDRALVGRVLARADAMDLNQAIGAQSGFRSMADVARELVARSITDEAEARRVLGGNYDGDSHP